MLRGIEVGLSEEGVDGGDIHRAPAVEALLAALRGDVEVECRDLVPDAASSVFRALLRGWRRLRAVVFGGGDGLLGPNLGWLVDVGFR